MKTILIAAALVFAASAVQAESCKSAAIAKNLSGAAQTSFVKKCEKDATANCDKQAAAKKLSGAAKTSFTKKCVTDAAG